MPDDAPSPSARPVVFGEALFDCFPDGTEVLGGAPFNVAWHLQGLGARPVLVSRVGTDRRGRRVLERMFSWGMDRGGIGLDAQHPTGTVQVSLEGGQPSFAIPPAQAWDRIEAKAVAELARGWRVGLVAHGTLALREGPTRDAFRALVETTRAPCFLDLNLRAPWDGDEVVEAALGSARWVKLNAAELARATGRACGDEEARFEAATALRRERGFEAVFVTLGADGALAVDAGDGRHRAAAAPVDGFVDAVGAGDAFSAVVVHDLLAGRPLGTMLQRAVAFAARVCTLRGAVREDRSLYEALPGEE